MINMIEGPLADHLDELDVFVADMKQKIQLRRVKHKQYNNSTEGVKEHLIEEILEMFKVPNYLTARLIKSQFVLCNVDIDEAIDVAIMAFALRLSMENDKILSEDTCQNQT